MAQNDPKYRRQKCAGKNDRAFVELNGRRYYLGRYGSDESRGTYHRLLAEWRGDPGRFKAAQAGPAKTVTVAEVIEAFWAHVQQFYVDPDGHPTKRANELSVFSIGLILLHGGKLRLSAHVAFNAILDASDSVAPNWG